MFPHTLSDMDLMHRMASDDERAFREIYDRYAPQMLEFVHAKIRKTRQLEDAKLIVHDAFLKLWNNRRTIRIQSSFSGYLYTILYHEILRFLRTLKDTRPFEEEAAAIAMADGESIEDNYHHKLVVRMMEENIRELPEKCKEVYQLSKEENLSHKEIAERLNISQHTVKNHLSKAFRVLKAGLQELNSLFF
ncbi:MAG: RNA polymerase sigma-70 factor [Chitinophagaceae bacterium]|nr:RNA polymerase sigma-70 factor [Chitinophagaceae bacterium]